MSCHIKKSKNNKCKNKMQTNATKTMQHNANNATDMQTNMQTKSATNKTKNGLLNCVRHKNVQINPKNNPHIPIASVTPLP